MNADAPLLNNHNFIWRFLRCAQQQPDKTAIVFTADSGTDEDSISFQGMHREAAYWQAFFYAKNLQPGDRVVLAIAPGILLYTLITGLLAAGMVPVFIDAGMGRRKVRQALQDANASAVISSLAALRWFWLIPELRGCQRFAVDGFFPGVRRLPVAQAVGARDDRTRQLRLIDGGRHAHGLISFTSGSTGRPKGADRTHDSLQQQHQAIRAHWPDAVDDVDCPCFPVMVLHNLSCGMTSVMPAVNFAAPGELSQEQAARTVAALQQWQVTRVSGAPAYMSALCDYLHAQQLVMEQVRSVIVGGATVSRTLAGKIQQCFPNAWGRIAYGSTEAEPVAAVTLEDYLQADGAAGYLVGAPVEGTEVLISHSLPADHATEDMVTQGQCQPYECGEILVAGLHVLRGYVNHPQAEAENKIPRDGSLYPVWHRTGDTGFFDSDGRLWLTGRVRDLIRCGELVIQPLVVEQQLDVLEGVQRCALVQSSEGKLLLFIQSEKTLAELMPVVRPLLMEAGIASLTLKRLARMPVDSRHNSKLDRPLLREDASSLSVLEHHHVLC